ncbi:Histidine--tRNA ligase [Anaerohalosphaera lusitana]|uniref:Histidine--tRNA ligase n=1 Tax=Anaerohalosphaera lusitana TaxID=1936003 RepID=A0A1U9NM80_9BACT|nr:histidine--tRNA ligase [Anaerohalosphaera lusitana]AQT69041.1 Histidine--tRNA ligase [Anaerohalosphaera lusitana]
MKIKAVKGTRDFYPQPMAVRNFIIDGWKEASLRNGFEEYDGPIFEYLKMYQVKSGDEIVEQLFNFEDRGGRHLAIRPEITPTLARMVNQQINALPRPIKWFSVPRLCRAERPQKGRLREFFQWNIDIIGVDSVLADAEVIFTSIDYLRGLGLDADDIKARISSRKLLAAFLKSAGIAEDQLESIYPVLDKKPKLPPEAFDELLLKSIPDSDIAEKVQKFMVLDDVAKIAAMSDGSEELEDAIAELAELFRILDNMGIADYCVFDPGIVRGLAYYTGVVFEVHDVVGELRALCGGGRYDNLLSDFGGPSVPATGMGMGDCVLEILLREKGLLKDDKLQTKKIDCFVAYASGEFAGEAVKLTAELRGLGVFTDFSYKGGNLGKQLKKAASAGASHTVIIGQEFADGGKYVLKTMATGDQAEVTPESLYEMVTRDKG